jgi:hypothetical protein
VGKHRMSRVKRQPLIARDPLAAALPGLVVVLSGAVIYRFPYWYVMGTWAIIAIWWMWWAIISQ